MNPHDFCCWLQGYFEIQGADQLEPEQAKLVKDRLASVFFKTQGARLSQLICYTPDRDED